MNIDDDFFSCSSSNYDSADSNHSSISDTETLEHKLSNTLLIRLPLFPWCILTCRAYLLIMSIFSHPLTPA